MHVVAYVAMCVYCISTYVAITANTLLVAVIVIASMHVYFK